MIYMGSKARIAKDILKVMQSDIDKTDCFVDMFCGGGNLLQYVNAKYIIANDINPYVIAFLERIQKEGCDWIPKNNKEFTQEHFLLVKRNKDKFKKSVLGHVGYNLSFGGNWFCSYRKDNTGKRDYVAEAYRGAVKQQKLLNKNILFTNKDYRDVDIPNNSTVYCDIPYKDTGKYTAVSNFNHEEFYNWCRCVKSDKNLTIYISEYDMPEDFECVWQKEIRVQQAKLNNSTLATEKLFKLK